MKKILCKIVGHDYFVIKELPPDYKKLGCHRCGCEWGMNNLTGTKVKWNEDLEELHNDIEEFLKMDYHPYSLQRSSLARRLTDAYFN